MIILIVPTSCVTRVHVNTCHVCMATLDTGHTPTNVLRDNLHFLTLNFSPLRMQFCNFAWFKKSENNYINRRFIVINELQDNNKLNVLK